MWNAETLQKLKEKTIPSLEGEMFSLNDAMAKNPELGSKEFESSKAIVGILRAHGFEVEYPFAGFDTAFKAVCNPQAKRRAVLLAEYDALPEIGHACGHCASGSATVLAGLALNAIRDEIDVGIDIIGTPDEEIQGIKALMTDTGVFSHYDFAAMAHMNQVNCARTEFLAMDGTLLKFFGAPAHAAAAPEKGRNALNAARLFFDAVDMMRQHVVSDARLHGYIRKAGVASNIVPDYAEIEFMSRALQRAQLNDITAWVYEIGEAAAKATRTRAEITPFGPPYHDLYISPAGEALMNACFAELGMDAIPAISSGSSDIGNVDYVIPAFHPMVSIGQDYMVHTAEFGKAMTDPRTHRAIVNAAKFLITLVWRLYGNPDCLREVTKQHHAYRGINR
jgi:amidohydrolase